MAVAPYNPSLAVSVAKILGTTGNAIVAQGSTTYGTNQTTALQNVINEYAGRFLIWDGQYAHNGLTLPSDAMIYFTPGSGQVLLPGSNAPLMRNSNSLTSRGVGGVQATSTIGSGTAATLGSFGNTNITIIGGIHNANGQAQTSQSMTYGFGCAFQLWGVKYLKLQDMFACDGHAYTFHFANWQYVDMQNIQVDTVNRPVSPSAAGFDGIHFNGPGQFADLRNMILCCGGDALAVNAEDGVTAYPFPFSGNITDFRCDGLTLYQNGTYGYFGVRINSNTSIADRIEITNIRGRTRALAINISGNGWPGTLTNWNVPEDQLIGEGNHRNIKISKVSVDVIQTSSSIGGSIGETPNCDIFIETGNSANIHISDVQKHTPTVAQPIVTVSGQHCFYAYPPVIVLEDVGYIETNAATTMPILNILGNAGQVIVKARSTRVDQIAAGDSPLVVVNSPIAGAGPESLELVGCEGRNINSLVEVLGGTVGTLKIEGIHDQAGAALAAPVTVASGATIRNLDTSKLLTTAASPYWSGSGTVTNNIGVSGTYQEPANGLLRKRCLASFRFSDSGGTTVTDFSGNENNLTAAATIVRGTGPASGANIPYSLTFNGSQSAQAAGNGDLCAGPYTVGVWCYFGSVSGVQVIWAKGSGSPGANFGLAYLNGTAFTMTGGASGSASNALAGTTVAIDTWYLLIITNDMNNMNGYINGSSTPAATRSWSLLSTAPTAYNFGWGIDGAGGSLLSSGSQLAGGFVAAGVWSATQMASYYNSGNGIQLF
jgi:hypothetical protein